MKLALFTLLAALSLTGLTKAQNVGSISGVWKVAEITVTGDKPGTLSNPQPGYMTFGKKYYSIMYVASDQERPPYAGATPTPEEKIAAFDTLFANAGMYDLKGNVLTIRPTVARNPGFSGGGYATYRVRKEGNTMWLTSKNGDFYFRIGGKIAPIPGGAANETTFKLTRLE